MSTPLVRNQYGAVLGIDWRRVPGLALGPVPGRVDVRNLMPGDRVRFDGEVVTVLNVHGQRSAQAMHVVTRTDRGAEIVREVVAGQEVDVVAVGAFDPVEES